MNRFLFTAEVSFGGDEPTWEGEVTYSFSVQPAERETRDCPGSGACVIDIEVDEIDGQRRPWGHFLGDDRLEAMMLKEAEQHVDDMLELALAEMADDAADAAEYRAEMRREQLEERL